MPEQYIAIWWHPRGVGPSTPFAAPTTLGQQARGFDHAERARRESFPRDVDVASFVDVGAPPSTLNLCALLQLSINEMFVAMCTRAHSGATSITLFDVTIPREPWS